VPKQDRRKTKHISQIGEGAGALADGKGRCNRHSVSRKKDESSGSILPLPLQFLAAWLGVWFARALQQQVDYILAMVSETGGE
jgi:hypothetical protein